MKNADWDIEGDLPLLEIEEDEVVSTPSRFHRLLTSAAALCAVCGFLMTPVSSIIAFVVGMPINVTMYRDAVDERVIRADETDLTVTDVQYMSAGPARAESISSELSLALEDMSILELTPSDEEPDTDSDEEGSDEEAEQSEAQDAQTPQFSIDAAGLSTSVVFVGGSNEENQDLYYSDITATVSTNSAITFTVVMQPQISTSTVEQVSNVYAAPSAERSTLDTYAAAEYVNAMLLVREDENADAGEDAEETL